MLEINPNILVIQLLTFVLGMGLIWMTFIKALGKFLSQRRDGIAKAIADSQKAAEDAAALKAGMAAELDRIRFESKGMLEQARAEAGQQREKLLEQARVEQGRMLESARAQIRRETDEAIQKVREDASALVVAATAKLLQQNLSVKAQDGLAKKFLEEIKR